GESGRNDQYKNFLLRNNCILYGAPGTGKTEFVKELNHVLINRYGKNSPERSSVVNLDPSDPNHGLTQDDEEKKPEPTIPIFVISGASLMSTGKDEPKTFEKFIITLKKAKNNFFKNPDEEGNIGEDSKLPYIVFVDEADQAKNSLTYNPQAKNNLEEFKNFFSQAEDGGGLKKEAQDLKVEPEKPSAKSRRVREAIKDIEDQEEKMRIKNEEEERCLCNEGHETEPFANWQDLESFDKPQKIMRYNFDDKKLLRERIRLLEKEVNEGNAEIINTFGGELRSISNQIEKISDLSGKNYEEFQNINQTLENLYQRLKDYYDSKSGLTEDCAKLVFFDPQYNHPHEKPAGLNKRLIEAVTQKGDLVVDPCAGSFTVLNSCLETKREFLGADINYSQIKKYMIKARSQARKGNY
ncbi:13390_t:CDS:2, partial [Racocetra persica]